MSLFQSPSRLIICLLLFGFAIGIPGSSTAAQAASTLPVLTSVTASTALPDSILVSGHGFTPGGAVFIALYDQWGATLHETRWVTSSTDLYGPHGTLDPSRGFTAGGNVREAFEFATETIYGANGSQDPAQGYQRGRTLSELSLGATCHDPLMVRAFDQQTNAWSNLLVLEVACGQ